MSERVGRDIDEVQDLPVCELNSQPEGGAAIRIEVVAYCDASRSLHIPMATDPRLSDKELAAINAAAVTRDFTVKPHLGLCQPTK